MTRTALSDYREFPIGAPIAGSVADPLSLGYVYIVGFSEAGIVKIGSALAPGIRLAELQCGNPFELHLRAAVSIYEGSPVLIERAAHKIARARHIRGEWFELDDDEALEVVIKAARNKKAKFGASVEAFRAAAEPVDHAAAEEARRKTLRMRLGIAWVVS